jgi:hypothetical protein
VDSALGLVLNAAVEVTGEELPVWDLRAVPLSAILEVEASAPSSSRLLRKRRSR